MNNLPIVREASVGVENKASRPALITGGAGFVGANLAHRLLRSGRRVIVLDNLSRPGVEKNAQWLCETHGPQVRIERGDIRDENLLRRLVPECGEVFHFAAQVAVTTSLANPVEDFEINARGALNLLEAIRGSDSRHPLIFTSTNKVYGTLEDVDLVLNGSRYDPTDPAIRAQGISEARRLDFHSPYGCSKGAADQYVLDYARIFNLPAAVLRMSCIYGPHQFGTEDQGWVAHFLIRAAAGQSILLYGDGMQVRDVLFVEDLVDAFLLAQANIGRISGEAFNIGGGPENTTSLLELLELIGRLHGSSPAVSFHPPRPGDQRYYVSNSQKFSAATGWQPHTSVGAGVQRLYDWLLANRPPKGTSGASNGHRENSSGKVNAGQVVSPAGVMIRG